MNTKKNRQQEPEKETKKTEWLSEYEAGPYSVSEAGALYFNKQVDGAIVSTLIADHAPILQEIIQRDDGTNTVQECIFKTFRNGKFGSPTRVDTKTMFGNQPNILFAAGNAIEPGRGNKERYSHYMQLQCKDKTPQTQYQHTGWIQVDGERVFLNGGYSIDQAGLTAQYTVELDPGMERYCFYEVPESERDGLNVLLQELPKAMPESVYVPLLGYCFLTPLNGILRSVGREPCFSLYLIGKTGTYKSSICKLFSCFFGKFSYADPAPVSFEDTENAVGRRLSVGADIPLLLDDRRPTTSPTDKWKYERMEKYVSCAIGDRVSRSRLNADSSAKKSYIPKCNLIVTAEEAFQNVGSSSIARSITIELEPGTIYFKGLQALQEKPQCFNKVMQLYIQYVIKNWDTLRQNSGDNLKQLEAEFTTAGHPRIATALSQLLFGYAMYLKFMQEYQCIDENHARELLDQARKVCRDIGEAQERRVEEETPTKLFINLFQELYAARKIQLVGLFIENDSIKARRIQTKAEGEGGEMVGYEDEQSNQIYLIARAAYNAVRRYYAESGNVFPVSSTGLWKQFISEGKILPEINSKTGKTRVDNRKTIDGEQHRYICFTLEASKELIGEEPAEE